MADHGGLIIMSPLYLDKSAKTGVVHYTWDEGLSWDTLKLKTEGNVTIENVFTEPESTT